MTRSIGRTCVLSEFSSQDLGHVVQWDEDFIHVRCPFCGKTHLLKNLFEDASSQFLIKQCPEYKSSELEAYVIELGLKPEQRRWGYYIVQFPVDRHQNVGLYELDKEEKRFVSCLKILEKPKTVVFEQTHLSQVKASKEPEVKRSIANIHDNQIDLIERLELLNLEETATLSLSIPPKASLFEHLGNTFTSVLYKHKENVHFHVEVKDLLDEAQKRIHPKGEPSWPLHLSGTPVTRHFKYDETLTQIRDHLRQKSTMGLSTSHNQRTPKRYKVTLQSRLDDKELASLCICTFIIFNRDETFNLKALRFLLASGCDVNGYESHDRSPLMIAVMWRRAKFVHVLLGHGADRLCRSKDGYTAASFLVPLKTNNVYGTETDQSNITEVHTKHDIKEEKDCRKIHLMLQYYKLPTAFIKLSNESSPPSNEVYTFSSKIDVEKHETHVTIEPLNITVPYHNKWNGRQVEKAVGVLRRGNFLEPRIAISGWSFNPGPESYMINAYYWTNKVLSFCRTIGHTLDARSRRSFASHVEKQLVMYLLERHAFLHYEIEEGGPLAELYKRRPGFDLQRASIYVSKNICDDCVHFFQCVEKYCRVVIDVDMESCRIDIGLN